ncbi:hypothetical protein RvY_16562 [Ramazzottius varieornatus]|uniref:Neurotransmitter-gated ion-channel ligand-binding domain-containing protein n=1 Tax=Ramazzottius varieornatus TaxID=947166 RepID=A0A1D1VYW6_RAMVA|nr:hypothetical protein RvY_16562 [Ramazzottius varieornatus]
MGLGKVVILCTMAALVAGQEKSARSAMTTALLRDLRNANDIYVRPGADIGGPTVWVNMHLFGLEKLKERTNVLQAGMSVDLRWNDPRLSWSPEEFGNLTTIFFPIKDMWIPDITIWQSADPLTPFFSKEQDICQIFSTGDVVWAPKARMTVYSNMTVGANGEVHHRARAYLGSWMLGVPQIDIHPSSPTIGSTMLQWSPLTGINTSVERVIQVFNEIPGISGYPLLEVTIEAIERGNETTGELIQ